MKKNDTPDQRRMRALCLMCCMAYFVSYLTRLNYTASMVEIQNTLGITKQLCGLPVTACFLSYGLGQVLFGILGDKLLPRNMIFTGLLGSALCNLLVPLLPRMALITALWCLNGMFQSMLWPPMIRIMAENMSELWYRKGCVRVSLSSSVATLLLYLLVPVCIQISGWKTVFFAAAVFGLLAALVWYHGTRHFAGCRREPLPAASQSFTGNARPRAALGVSALLLLLAIVLHGILKDGITAWMPVYLAETFGMDSAQSILSATVLPVCSVCSTLLSSALLYKLKNEFLTASLLFGASALAGIFMIPASGSYPAVCIGAMTLITGCMYGVNLMLLSRVPGHFAAYGNISTITGILNAATYVGSALSTYGFGAIAQSQGWTAVVTLWVIVALAGTLFLTAEIRKWGRFCCRKAV